MSHKKSVYVEKAICEYCKSCNYINEADKITGKFVCWKCDKENKWKKKKEST